MNDLIEKALTAKRESKHVEFKQSFDPNSAGEWCELIKDLAAIANSGGGIIVFGLDNVGTPTGGMIDRITALDPADIANKLSKYTGSVDFEFEIRSLEKTGHKLAAFVMQPVLVPLVFQKPGTYDIGSGKQRTAFSMGTVYFRHGAKSEPGTSEDIRRVIERHVERIRRSWIKGVRKVVQAPHGSQIVAVHSASNRGHQLLPTTVRAVNDPTAIPIRLTRDPALASGSFVYEEVSDGIFDEINNVIDANQVLAQGRKDFFLGQPVYYRIYAERHHVRQSEEALSLLLCNGVVDFYAPALFWAVASAKQVHCPNAHEPLLVPNESSCPLPDPRRSLAWTRLLPLAFWEVEREVEAPPAATILLLDIQRDDLGHEWNRCSVACGARLSDHAYSGGGRTSWGQRYS